MHAIQGGEGPLVLVVDDDPDMSSIVRMWLEQAGFRVRVFATAETFLEGLSTCLPDAVCLDIGLPGLSGMEALKLVRVRQGDVPVLMLTADNSVASVVDAMQCGALDYLAKPVDEVRLLTAVHNAVERFRALPKNELSRALEQGSYGGIVGRSPVMREVFLQVERVAGSDISVLVQGESGTGKELVARAIHERSARHGGPFIAVNCAAIPETLQDSELFGHEKGAFTGALAARPGRFEQAHRGTLFLDEIAELSPMAQAKLLRVLQERRFERVGGSRTVTTDFRLLAATHKDLWGLVRQGAFREDLFFRIAVFDLHLPPLRERSGDVALLVDAILQGMASRGRKKALRVSAAAFDCLARYSWPGNVRELGNVLERAAVIADNDSIELADLPPQIRQSVAQVVAPMAAVPPSAAAAPTREGQEKPRSTQPASPSIPPLNLDDLERWAIEQALKRSKGNMAEVVRKLGIGKTTLYRKLKKYGIRSAD